MQKQNRITRILIMNDTIYIFFRDNKSVFPALSNYEMSTTTPNLLLLIETKSYESCIALNGGNQ
jgi:hypothetical protein